MEISIDKLVVKIDCSFCPKRYTEIIVDFFGREFLNQTVRSSRAGVYMEISIDMLQLIYTKEYLKLKICH